MLDSAIAVSEVDAQTLGRSGNVEVQQVAVLLDQDAVGKRNRDGFLAGSSSLAQVDAVDLSIRLDGARLAGRNLPSTVNSVSSKASGTHPAHLPARSTR